MSKRTKRRIKRNIVQPNKTNLRKPRSFSVRKILINFFNKPENKIHLDFLSDESHILLFGNNTSNQTPIPAKDYLMYNWQAARKAGKKEACERFSKILKKELNPYQKNENEVPGIDLTDPEQICYWIKLNAQLKINRNLFQCFSTPRSHRYIQ